MSVPTLPTARTSNALNPRPMSPAQAAHQVRASRRTIMRAIKSGELPAFRDNRNHWQIDDAELMRWAEAQWASAEPRPSTAQVGAHSITLQLVAAQATISQLEGRLEAAERDRDQWHSMAEKLAEKPPSTPRRRRWWFFQEGNTSNK